MLQFDSQVPGVFVQRGFCQAISIKPGSVLDAGGYVDDSTPTTGDHPGCEIGAYLDDRIQVHLEAFLIIGLGRVEQGREWRHDGGVVVENVNASALPLRFFDKSIDDVNIFVFIFQIIY